LQMNKSYLIACALPHFPLLWLHGRINAIKVFGT
jgi:hypothetical protein